jgi:hypothetical protein
MRGEKHFKTSENGITEDAANTRRRQQSVANLKEFVCNYCLVINIVRTCKS